MQLDMHYYATFYLARKAGIPQRDAETIAYAAQYVDDSSRDDSEMHRDRGLLYGIASAHHPLQCVLNRFIDDNEQRRVWVPFHFLPGGVGESFEEKLVCLKDSPIANEMFQNHLSKNCEYQIYLIGIACHTFMDTFSHYGFSGISSEYNDILEGSFELEVQDPDMMNYVLGKKGDFLHKFGLEKCARLMAEKTTDSLGHGGAMTFPDRPYLKWKLDFLSKHPEYDKITHRNNQETFLEGCGKLYRFLSLFSIGTYNASPMDFSEFEDKIKQILAVEAKKEDRILLWIKEIGESAVPYDPYKWENQKKHFGEFPVSADAIDSEVYRFHQAVCYHRYYVLKELLPKHRIAVY
jgi:hypothetical protein